MNLHQMKRFAGSRSIGKVADKLGLIKMKKIFAQLKNGLPINVDVQNAKMADAGNEPCGTCFTRH